MIVKDYHYWTQLLTNLTNQIKAALQLKILGK